MDKNAATQCPVTERPDRKVEYPY